MIDQWGWAGNDSDSVRNERNCEPCVLNDLFKIKLFLELRYKMVLASIVEPMILIANRRSTNNTIAIGPKFLIANIRSTFQNTISGHKLKLCRKPHHIEQFRFVFRVVS